MSVEKEFAWLLERGPAMCPQYACIKNGTLDWTAPGDHASALRLARREDADALASIMEDADRVAQHGWHFRSGDQAHIPTAAGPNAK